MTQIFISYAREDVAVAKLVKTSLQAGGYTATLDIDDFTRGNWAEQITAKLMAASDVLVFVGPASLASDNVGDEVRQALAHGKPLVPVLMAEPPAMKPEWAVALLRYQAARYDALDLDVSLARIVRLLSCTPLLLPNVASPASPSTHALASVAASHPPPKIDPVQAMQSTLPAARTRPWPWAAGAAATAVALALALWFIGLRQFSEGAAKQPELAASAVSAVAPGKLQISFKGVIRREQMVSLEGKLREIGFTVARSERSEAVEASYVGHGDAHSAALAKRVRALAQAHFDALGCRLGSDLVSRPRAGPPSPPGDLTLSVVGVCP